MFLGTTPATIMSYLQERVKELSPKNAFSPFAGNFCNELLVSKASKDIHIHSTDVSLYSKAIGFGLTGVDYDIKPDKFLTEKYSLISGKTEPLEKAALMIFFTEIMQNMVPGIKYYDSMIADSVYHQEKYFDKIYAKLVKFKNMLGPMTFYGVDACDIIQTAGEGDYIFYDPLSIVGSGDKMFEGVESHYQFTPTNFTEITPFLVFEHLKGFSERGVTAYFRSLNVLERGKDIPEEYEEVVRFGYKASSSYHLYTNSKDVTKRVTRFKILNEEVAHYPLITSKDEITRKSKVNFIKVKEAHSNHYRLMWVKKAAMSKGGVPYLIFVDQKLIGLVHIQSGQQFGTELASIFTDPACPHSKYKRLSKLIIALVSTKQFLDMFNEETMWKHKGLSTKVFTNADASMKYRNLFELVKREDTKEGSYKQGLIYQNRDKIFKTYKEALSYWLDKDGKIVE